MSKRTGARSQVTEDKLKRKTPAKADDLEFIAKKLGLANHTQALEEAITIACLIVQGRRRSFYVEEADGRIVKITL